MKKIKNIVAGVALLLGVASVGYVFWQRQAAALPPSLVSANGRLEATEVDVASKIPGRIAAVMPREGDWVEAGTVVARLVADELRAQLRAAEASVVQAERAVDQGRAGVRKSRADLQLADKTLQRSEELVGRGFISRNKLDSDQSGMEGAMAGMAQAQGRVAEAGAAVAAARARVEVLQANLRDSELQAPVSGRVLYRLAEPGEVLAAGGKVLTLLDLSEMHLTVFLPTALAGQVALGSEARIVLDALPQQPLPATVSFVAAKAQFTPREVETRGEREKLMFRVKVRVDPDWLAAHRDLAKSGMPGVAYLKLATAAPWPAALAVAR